MQAWQKKKKKKERYQTFYILPDKKSKYGRG